MKREIIIFNEDEVFQKAKEHFIKIAGFRSHDKKHLKMLEEGMKARDLGLGGIEIKAVVSSYGGEVYQDHKVNIEGTEFACTAFSQINDDIVKKVYAYLLTVGECTSGDEDGIMTQLYADIWGTAYTEAARDVLQDFIVNDIEKNYPDQLNNGLFLSDTFGPGFYGMDVAQSIELFQVLNGESIGIQVRDSGIMLPLKSCSGLFLLVTDSTVLPKPDCRDCLGSVLSCSFCLLRKES
ncbi:MAG: hypothetical protein ACOX5F_09185 [Anaerovoracaceae bacterium]|jgi:hypothetical protein